MYINGVCAQVFRALFISGTVSTNIEKLKEICSFLNFFFLTLLIDVLNNAIANKSPSHLMTSNLQSQVYIRFKQIWLLDFKRSEFYFQFRSFSLSDPD